MATRENTLLVKNLPVELAVEARVELLQHFGATHVRCMPTTGRMRHSAFASFPSKEDAKQALSRLHQLQVLGKHLVAVFALRDHENRGLLPHVSDPVRPGSGKFSKEKSLGSKEELQSKVEDFQKWLSGMAPDLGLGYPRCPLLHYKYPAPTQSIINNIGNALAAVPKFYTQVLHLMNAMNLPAPFGAPTPTPPLAPDHPTETLTEEEMQFSSTEESEMESDTENKSLQEEVKKRPSKVKKKKRVLKRPRLMPVVPGPASSAPAVDPSAVFDMAEVDTIAKKISFNIRPTEEVQATVCDEPKVEEGGFGVLERPSLPSALEDGGVSQESIIKWKEAKFVTQKELDRNRVSNREMKGMSVFKNYQSGEATCRLYVKNLAKQVSEADLFNIYGRYINQHLEQERNMFDIRLMKEGRMKGQAFVTLANQMKAQDALRDTNGYILHGKPIVVQYARSAKPREQEQRK